MDEESQLPEPKISESEIILIGMFYGLLDLIDFIPVAGDVTDAIAAPMGLYYWSKGLNGTTFIVAEVLDLFPVVQAIPSRTIGWGITVWLDRHPNLEAKLAPALEVAEALEGNVENGEGAAAERSTVAAENTTAGAAANTGEMTGRAAGAGGTGEPGEYQIGENGGTEKNAKPSETSTERDNENNQGQENKKPSERDNVAVQGDVEDEENEEGEIPGPQETEEDRKKREADERYKEIEAAAVPGAVSPMERAEQEDFSAEGPQSQAMPKPEASQASETQTQDNEETQRRSALFKERQALRRSQQKAQEANPNQNQDQGQDSNYISDKAA